MFGIDLQNISLKNANLSNCNLTNADITNADLSETNLTSINIGLKEIIEAYEVYSAIYSPDGQYFAYIVGKNSSIIKICDVNDF